MSNQRRSVIKIEDLLHAYSEAPPPNRESMNSRSQNADHSATVASQPASPHLPTSSPYLHPSTNTRFWCTVCASEKPWSRSNRDECEREEMRHQSTLKQAWSCGFCFVSLFSFHDRQDHLEQHFEHGRHINSWSATQMITGLLWQPSLHGLWEAKLRSVPSRGSPVWERSAVEDLQHQLEMGPRSSEHAAALVEAAYAAHKTY